MRSVITNPNALSAPPTSHAPSLIVVGGIDWRFADPLADGLAGFNFGKFSTSPLARSLVTGFIANQGLTEADMKRIFEGLCGVDQVVLSIHDDRIVVMVTGGVSDANLPDLAVGWKAVPAPGNAMLIGNAEAVDLAVQRIASDGPLSELTRLAADKQAGSDFWAVGSGKLAGPSAVSIGLKRFSLMGWVHEQVESEVAFEFNETPDPRTLPEWATALDGAAIDGHVLYGRMTMDNRDKRQFDQFAGSPLGRRLGAVLQAARNLPVRDTIATKPNKPVIYGLDDGPRVVKQ